MLLIAFLPTSHACTGATPYNNPLTSTCVSTCPWAPPQQYYGNPNNNQCQTTCTWGYGLPATKLCVSACPYPPTGSQKTYKDNTNKICATVCPSNPNLFAQDSTQSCVSVCAGSMFADQTTRACVSVCPAATFTFINGTTRYCKSLCPTGYFKDGSSCIAASSCPTNYYGDTVSATCVRNCPSSDSTWGDNGTRTCLKYCPSGSYSVDSPYRICIAVCPQTPPALFGSSLLRKCVTACPGYTFADPTTYECQFPCSSGYFADSTSGNCVKLCPLGYFSDSSTNTCVTTCSAGTFANNATRSCIGTCPIELNLFGDLTLRKCVTQYNCPTNPYTYADPQTRTCVQTCPSTPNYFGNKVDRLCGLNCPWNPNVYQTYKDTNARACVTSCPTNPLSFADISTKSCVTSCPQTPAVISNTYADFTTMTCVTTCPLGYSADTSTFVCVSNCSSSNWYNPTTQTCLTSCPNPLLRQNTTRSCLSSCTSNPSTYADFTTLTCVATCPSNYFALDTTRTCVQLCPEQTLTFASTNTGKCMTVCPSAFNQYAQYSDRTCRTNCGSGFFAYDTNRTCLTNCPTNLLYFGDTVNNVCVLQCPNSFFADPVSFLCVSVCPTYPVTYYGDQGLRKCVLNCPTGYYKDSINNLCVLPMNCPSNQYADPVTLNCVLVCPSNATLTYFAQPTTKVCTSICLSNTYADRITRKCQTICTSGQFKDPISLRCVSVCPSTPDMYAYNGVCVQTCPANTPQLFAQNVTRSCVTSCPYTPLLYADLTTGRCVTSCLTNNTYIYTTNTVRQCVGSCPNGLFADPSVGRCVSLCNNNTLLFADPNTFTCVYTCPKVSNVLYFADGRTRSCKTTCPTDKWNTFADPVTQTCSLNCQPGFFRDSSVANAGVCTTQCTAGLFSDPTTSNCVTVCPNPLLADTSTGTGRCVKSCPDGTFANITAKACFSNCAPNLGFWGNNYTFVCVTSCPTTPKLFAYDTALRCVQTCPSTPSLYANQASKRCVAAASCQASYYADPLSRMCVQKCPREYDMYGQNSTNQCVSTCLTGFADNQTQICVSTCPFDLSYYGHNLKCVKECPSGFWKDNSTKQCKNLCPAPSLADVSSGYCVNACPYAYFGDNRAGVNLCVFDCPTTPLLYADDYSKLCVATCPLANGSYGVVLNGRNVCVNPCPVGKFGVNSSRTCQNSCTVGFKQQFLRMCVSVCSTIPLIYGDTTTNTCVRNCPASSFAYIDSSMICVSRCPGAWFGNPLTYECQLTCPQGYYRDTVTNLCTTQCDNSNGNQYIDPSTKNCVSTCPSQPDLFADVGVTPFACVFNCSAALYMDNASSRLCRSQCTLALGTYLDTVTMRCVATCPLGFYADNNRVCVISCPTASGGATQTYADPTTRVCVAICPTGYFAQSSNKKCMSLCPVNKFADSSSKNCQSTCTTTSPRQYADPSTRICVTQCPILPLMFGQNGTKTCVFSCTATAQYAKTSLRVCVAAIDCNPQFADPLSVKCVSQCPFSEDRYADPVTFTCQKPCSSGYNTDPSTMNCVSVCPSVPSLFAYNGNCISDCLSTATTLFGDPVSRTCSATCPFSGANIYYRQNTTRFCVRNCPVNSFSDNTTRYCVSTCTLTTYADNSTWQCVFVCPSSPAMFSDIVSRTCVINCPSGFFADPTTRACVSSCPTQPMYFKYFLERICTQICPFPYGKQLSSGKCVDKCLVGFYLNITQNMCIKCLVQCVTCTAQLACTSCIFGYFLSLGKCGVACSVNPPLFADPTSQSCVPTCSNGYFGLDSTRTCVTACPASFFGNSLTSRCVACATGCLTCSGSNCFTCAFGYIHSTKTLTCKLKCNQTKIFYYLSQCFSACPQGSYLLADQVTCQSCNTACLTCSLIASNCTACVNAFVYNNKCVTKCPLNYFASRGQCVSCQTNAQACKLPPLNYTVTPFYNNYKLFAYVVFNRQVTINASNLRDVITVNLNKISSSDYTYTVSKYNSTTYLLQIVTTNNVALNQNALSVGFNPVAVVDSAGQQLAVSQQNSSLPQGISTSNAELKTGAKVQSTVNYGFYGLAALVILMLFVKSYLAIIAIQIAQIVWMHNFVNLSIGYLYNMVLGKVSFVDFNWMPNPLTLLIPENYTSAGMPIVYQQSVPDMTFLRNFGPFIMLLLAFAFIILISSLLAFQKLSKPLKLFMQDHVIPRLKWSLLVEWLSYSCMPLIFFGFYQFVTLDLASTWNYINLILAIGFVLAGLGLTGFITYLGFKHYKKPKNLPQQFDILGLQPTSTVEIPARLLRRILLGILLVPQVYSLQIFGMISVNGAFLILLIFLQNSKLNSSRFKAAKELGWSYTEYIFNKILLRLIEASLIVFEILIVSMDRSSSTMFVVAAMVPCGTTLFWVFWRGWLSLRQKLSQKFPQAFGQKEEDMQLEAEIKVKKLDQVAAIQMQESQDDMRNTQNNFNIANSKGRLEDVPDKYDEIQSINSDEVANQYDVFVKHNQSKTKVKVEEMQLQESARRIDWMEDQEPKNEGKKRGRRERDRLRIRQKDLDDQDIQNIKR